MFLHTLPFLPSLPSPLAHSLLLVCPPSSTSLVEEGNVVRLRGLPYKADMKDVATFLAGLNIIPYAYVCKLYGVKHSISEQNTAHFEMLSAIRNNVHLLLIIIRHTLIFLTLKASTTYM